MRLRIAFFFHGVHQKQRGELFHRPLVHISLLWFHMMKEEISRKRRLRNHSSKGEFYSMNENSGRKAGGVMKKGKQKENRENRKEGEKMREIEKEKRAREEKEGERGSEKELDL